jgi:spermidine/putrescine transport system permease protein
MVAFLTRGAYGEVSLPLTLENLWRFLGISGEGIDLVYPFILIRSLLLGIATAALCAVLALPVCFFISLLPERFRPMALLFVTIPFWTNLLVRTYSWQLLLSPGGIISRPLELIGLIPEGGGLYPGFIAVMLGMVGDYLPFFILPLYTAVEKIDWALIDAARDLGANRYATMRHAVLPQISRGLATGALFVGVPAAGSFVVPDLLGGAKVMFYGNALAQQFGASRDWPFGAMLGFIGFLMTILVLRSVKRDTLKDAGDLL